VYVNTEFTDACQCTTKAMQIADFIPWVYTDLHIFRGYVGHRTGSCTTTIH